MRGEPAQEHAVGHRAVVVVRFAGRDGITEREVASSEFDAGDRGVSMGSLVVPWSRVVCYEHLLRQPFVPDQRDPGSRAMQRVVFEDERGAQHEVEVPFDRFESGPHVVTVVERELHADRGEVLVRKTSIPWHKVVETERILSVPDPSPARPDR